jgi:D-serine deaminase-like pyridoxal phosphate-dependent protein
LSGIVVSTLAEAEFFAAGGHRTITFGSPVIPWCAPPLLLHTWF